MKREKDQEIERIINLGNEITKVEAPESIYSGKTYNALVENHGAWYSPNTSWKNIPSFQTLPNISRKQKKNKQKMFSSIII